MNNEHQPYFWRSRELKNHGKVHKKHIIQRSSFNLGRRHDMSCVLCFHERNEFSKILEKNLWLLEWGRKFVFWKLQSFFQLHKSLLEIYIHNGLLKKFHRFRCPDSVRRSIWSFILEYRAKMAGKSLFSSWGLKRHFRTFSKKRGSS